MMMFVGLYSKACDSHRHRVVLVMFVVLYREAGDSHRHSVV